MSRMLETIAGLVLVLFGIALVTYVIFMGWVPATTLLLTSALLVVVGAVMAIGYKSVVRRLSNTILVEYKPEDSLEIQQRTLDPAERSRKQNLVAALPIPGLNATEEFSSIRDAYGVDLLPTSDAMVPMYSLDSQFRIIDWNEALGLAFDRTMEGHHGLNVLEWVYFLENYKSVVDNAVNTFGNPDTSLWPNLHVEELVYESTRYGKICARMRAYKRYGEDQTYQGWLAILDLSFDSTDIELRYYEDLMKVLNLGHIWTEYALCYDQVLANTQVYWSLVLRLLGEKGEHSWTPIREGSRVLDLGAGTGNIAHWIAKNKPDSLVIALENNSAMLSILRTKCKEFLAEWDADVGVIPLKQNITSLFGLRDSWFDYVIMNNVLYSLPKDSVDECLTEIHRVLRPNGELRISGPQKTTKLHKLMKQIRRDLKKSGKFNGLSNQCDRVENINNHRLDNLLYQYSVTEVAELLHRKGFKVIGSTDSAYAGQAMIVVASK